jgi:DNA-binding MarR family transcriptional regulator
MTKRTHHGSAQIAQEVVTTSIDADSPQLLLENQVCFPLYSAANAVVRAYRPYLDALNLTYLQYMVLLVLWQESSLRVRALGERLSLDSGTLTPLLKRMEDKGFVSRRRGKQDERERIISLTAKGLALREQARDIPLKLAGGVGLPPAKAHELKSLCQQLLEALARQERQ